MPCCFLVIRGKLRPNRVDYDEESDIYYKNLDFGWNTGFRAGNATADISDDKSKLYTQFELINQWYDVEGRSRTNCNCRMPNNILYKEKTYLRFENMEILKKLVD